MDKTQAYRNALIDGDVEALRRLHAVVTPHLPQPKSFAEAEITMHAARTGAESVPIRLRAYSHRWLEERALPSLLPDHLKPSVDRIYPRVAEAVGISVNFRSAGLKPAATAIRRVMESAVEDAFANGDKDPALVKSLMMEARAKETKALFGRLPT